MKMLHPIYFLALGLFGVYTIEFGVVTKSGRGHLGA